MSDRHSIRLVGYDYSQSGYYFVTICTQNRECILGSIYQGRICLTKEGEIFELVLAEISREFNFKIDVCQIMPNHVHMIVVVGAGSSRPLSAFVAKIKYMVTKQIYLAQGAKTAPLQIYQRIFQRNYYERIIRSEPEYYAICEYIRHNPKHWETDKEHVQ